MRELNAAIRDIPIPRRMNRLLISSRGYPVPWFVHIDLDKEADFRIIGQNKLVDALNKKLCWLCGEPLGQYMCFTVGPMCVISKTSSEPPSHVECSEYAVRACPFLNNPKMKRNEKDLPSNTSNPAGIMILRNPGSTALYVTKSYKVFRARKEGEKSYGYLIQMGFPTAVRWYCEGRPATREEVQKSIDSGIPILRVEAAKEGYDAAKELDKRIQEVQKLLPLSPGG